jgi:hypothetical protein
MALIIEDGTVVSNANSYVTLAEARTYAAARGVNLPADDVALEALLIKAMDYLEAQRARYQGSKTEPGVQVLQWPRTGVVLDSSYELPENVIPRELKYAQSQMAMSLHAGFDPLSDKDGSAVKRQKVDVLEVEYMTPDEKNGADGVSIPAVDALLAPLFGAVGGFFLTTVRV